MPSMNVLVHGTPFFCDAGIVRRYRGPHDLRTFGPGPNADFSYSPLEETACEAIARIAKSWPPDLVMCWQPEAHPPPRGIEDVPIYTVALVSDWNVYYPVLETNLARYDVVLTDRPGVEVFSSDRVSAHHLRPLYSQITPIHFPHEVDKDIDVLFIGNLNHAAHARRARFLERLAKRSHRYRVVIATGIEGDAYGRLMSRARIVFNHSIRGEVNLRVFETMACGAMAMLEDDNTEVRDWFTDGEDIVLYNDTNFEAKLDHYVAHTEETEAIARAGRQKIAAMSGEHTIDDLIDRAAALPKSDRRFRSLPEHDQLLQTALMYGRLPHGRWRPYVAGLYGHLLDAAPHNADVHAAYVHFLLGAAEKDWHRIHDHAQRAAELEPESIPYALNALKVEEWITSTKPDASKLLPLLEKHGTQGAGLLFGAQSDPFWSRCYRHLAEGDGPTPDMLHAEVLVRSVSAMDDLQEALQRLDRADALDPAGGPRAQLRAELMWNLGLKADAIAYLHDELPALPLNMAARETLLGWLQELGRMDEWQALTAETLGILKAFPEST